MADVEMRAEGLVSGGQEGLDCVECGRLHQIDHDRGRKDRGQQARVDRTAVLQGQSQQK